MIYLEYPIMGGDKSVPEFRTGGGEACNPFPTDVYYLGNMIREHFLQKVPGFEFMLPLIADMMREDPEMRPTIDEAVERFEKLYSSLSLRTLRSRLASAEDGLFHWLRHFFRTTAHNLTLRDPLPRPPRHPLHTFTSSTNLASAVEVAVLP